MIEGGDSAAQGAALLAFVAADKKDTNWLAAWNPRVEATYAPEVDASACYERQFEVFCALYPALKPTFSMLAE